MTTRRRRVRCVAILAVAWTAAAAGRATAQGGLLLQGIVDIEGWSAPHDTISTFLTRNHGRPGVVGRLSMWTAIEPWRGIFVFAQGLAESGTARPFGDRGPYVALEQGGIRLARDERLVVNVGRIPHPMSAFGARRFSTRNPLIGVPDGYTPVYPLGAQVDGEVGRFDYRAAVVSLPLDHQGYVPDADVAFRPVIGLGVTPFTGLHVGVNATAGPYLNKDFTSAQLASQSWESYRTRQLAADIEYGFRHFDFRGEYGTADYEVPGKGRSGGYTYYGEGRYTFTPRIFAAARYEVNNYPFIRPISATAWVARRTDFFNEEAGIGFRATASTIVKASYRVDHWHVTPANASFVRLGGHAVAVQLSQAFDVMDWFGKVR